MRAALLVGLLCAASCGSAPFGVELHVTAPTLTATEVSKIVQLRVRVTGEATPYEKVVSVNQALASGEARVRYIPGIKQGSLSFVLDALDATDRVLRSGTSGTIALVPGRSVDAFIVLGASMVDLGDVDGLKKDLPNGDPCTVSAECRSTFCVDAVCCGSACTASCSSCALTGALGVCTPVVAGQDPRGECNDDGTPCGLDGTCNGTGGCRYRTADTVCKSKSCSLGVLTQAALCDGLGSCGTGNTRVCDPWVCKLDGTDCYSTCNDSTACKSPNACVSMSCGKSGNGALCAGTGDCLSGNCVDGVCCGTGSCAACNACNVAGREGSCAPIKADSPEPRCAGAPPCGPTGLCDGAGACALAATTVQCAPGGGCSGNTGVIQPSYCNGAGACGAANVKSCSPYLCAGGACYTDCGSCDSGAPQGCGLSGSVFCATGHACVMTDTCCLVQPCDCLPFQCK